MKDIKFRAWLKSINKMTYPGTIDDIIKWAPLGCTPIWLQYTGITDRNDKEIYEGDIIKDRLTKALLVVKFGFCETHACVGWYCSYINIRVKDCAINGDYDTAKNNMIEVIGNVFENPELIQQEVQP